VHSFWYLPNDVPQTHGRTGGHIGNVVANIYTHPTTPIANDALLQTGLA
jgi:hypothetical protein